MKIAQVGTDSILLGGITAATTARTASLDCQGGGYASIRVAVGAELNTDSTNVAIAMSESDDNTTFVTFNSSFTRTVDNTAATVATNHIDLEGRKRYLKLTITPDTTTNGDVITSASATLYKDVISAASTMLGPNVVLG